MNNLIEKLKLLYVVVLMLTPTHTQHENSNALIVCIDNSLIWYYVIKMITNEVH